MSFISNLFRSRRDETVLLIDIGAGSVAGALAQYSDDALPTIVYARHLPIEIQEGEEHSRAMLRALGLLVEAITEEGLPALSRAAGNTRLDNMLVSIDAPWQETHVSVEEIAQDTPFTFTKHLASKTVQKVSAPVVGKVYTNASVIGTTLNGYETSTPYGKHVSKASLIILTSLVDEPVAKSILDTLRGIYARGTTSSIIAGGSLRYQAMRTAFPHEKDALILDATGPFTTMALVRRGLLVAVAETPATSTTGASRADQAMQGFGEIAKQYPLPHTIFLLTRDDESAALEATLKSMKLGALWLSDNPPKIMPILTTHLTSLVKQATTPTPDLPILLLALYYMYQGRAA